jgi:hypothetical protein
VVKSATPRAAPTGRPPLPPAPVVPPRRASLDAQAQAGAQSAAARERAEQIAARRRRDPSRARGRTGVIVAVLVGLAVVLVAVLLIGGGSAAHKGSSTTAASRGTHSRHAAAHAGRSSGARAGLSVVVLNGTETTGLAHRVSGQLQQSGYAHASALSGRPPGANQVTVVQYAPGHKADAEGVAHTVGAAQAQPLEETVSSLAPSASVVVIVGLDKAPAGT